MDRVLNPRKPTRSPLAPTTYYDILARHLVPMFPGARLEAAPVSIPVSGALLAEDGRNVLVRPDPKWSQSFRITRATGFAADDIRLVRQFVRAFREKLVAADQPFFNYLVDRCSEDVVARSVRHASVSDDLFPIIIALLRKWAVETYEGHPIVAAIGVDPHTDPAKISAIHIASLEDKSYAKVLSNGMDTLLVLSPSGHIVEHLSVSGLSQLPPAFVDHPFAPRRHLELARWASGQRVTMALNRQGEILVFKGQKLKFAFRSGAWSHFAHDAMLSRMGGSASVMRAVYASCLDVSFSRTGGCIAVAKSGRRASGLVSDSDLLVSSTTDKVSLLRHLIGHPFADIPRAIREELTALDGATVLDRAGTILAVGAIVRVVGGSEGGGRLAAAKALSRLGLAVKISADGGIRAFTDRGDVADPEIAFEVCI